MNNKQFMVKIYEIIQRHVNQYTGETGLGLPVFNVCFMHVLKFSYRLVLHYYILTIKYGRTKLNFKSLLNARSLEENLTPIRPPIPLKTTKIANNSYLYPGTVYIHTSHLLHPVKISHMYSELYKDNNKTNNGV